MVGAGLQLHPEKTRLVDMTEAGNYFDFLGYRFKRGKTGKLLKVVRPKSLQKLRAGLRKPTKRANGKCMEAIIAEINPVLRGWYEYFKQAHANTHTGVDGWVRMRLRSVLRKRQKKGGRGRGFRPPQVAQALLREPRAVQPGTSLGRNHESPPRRKSLTGEPCAGDLHARFGGGGGANQCVVPTSIWPVADASCVRIDVSHRHTESRTLSNLPRSCVRSPRWGSLPTDPP